MQKLNPNNELGVTIKLPRQGKIVTNGEDDRTIRWEVFKHDRFQATKNF